MTGLKDEVKNNFEIFTSKWRAELTTIQTALDSSKQEFFNSYIRLTSINSWRELLIKSEVTEEAYRFFCEAQNDGVSSHVFARMGSCRAALKSLRSCIENIFYCEYYKDHPVELQLWLKGKHRLGFNEMMVYFQKHPDIEGISDDLAGLERLQAEYSILSRAVHASSFNFRMTEPDGTTNLWSSDIRKLGMWRTRERHTITGVNLFLIALHNKSIQGTRLPGLRKSIALTINSSMLRNDIRTNFKVNLDITD